MDIDHIVLWVDNAERSLDFYMNILGLEAVRLDEFSFWTSKIPKCTHQ